MAGVFDQIITKGVRAGQIPARTDQARAWYRDAAKEYATSSKARGLDRKLMREEKERFTNRIWPGAMYMFYYDPKYKETLPFYDRFPLIFPFRVESDRFWGLNLHYLPLNYRAMLMDGLYDLTNNDRYDESTRLRLKFNLLTKASKFRWYKPCVKQYLFSQLESRFLYVYPSEWDIALFLPTERFQKATKSQVFSNSRSIISGT